MTIFPFHTLHTNAPNLDLIREHCTWLIAGGYAKTSIQGAYELLTRVDTDLPHGLAGALPQELAGWIGQNLAWSQQTKATYRSHIVRFYAWAADPDDPVLTFNPAVRLRRPRVNPGVPNPASDDEVHAAVTRTAQPYQRHCVLAAYAGLRPIEIAALRREDITETQLRIRSGKGAKPAVVPTEPAVWRAVRHLPAGPVTRRLDGRPADAHWVSIKTARHLRKHGIDITLRRLRHWHATNLRRHHDLFIVQQRMRHANIRTTQGYAQVTADELARSVGQLPDFTAPTDVADGEA